MKDEVKISTRADSLLCYCPMDHPTTSAFLMEDRKGQAGRTFLIIEFSEKGRAAYVCPYGDFGARGVTLRRAVGSSVKVTLRFDKFNRMPHLEVSEPKAGLQALRGVSA